MMKAAREIAVLRLPSTETSKLRQRLTVIRRRLETHNRLEESRVYKWSSFFDEKTIAELRESLRHELKNLPPRFAESRNSEGEEISR